MRRNLNLCSHASVEACLDRAQHPLQEQNKYKTHRELMEDRVTFLGTRGRRKWFGTVTTNSPSL